jgi:phosphomannomutase
MAVSPIKFGTDGWRGIIAQDFTFDNVRLCAQGVANYHLEQGLGGQAIVVGFDTRFASREFAVATAEVLAGNGFPVLLAEKTSPTPVMSFNIVSAGAAGGVMITASHNPKQWNGFKYRTYYGGSPSSSVIEGIESKIPLAQEMSVVRNASYADASNSGLIRLIDPDISYLKQVQDLIDLERLRQADMMVVIDGMHGAGGGYFPQILGVNNPNISELRSGINPSFPGMQNPEPVEHNLGWLSKVVRDSDATMGLALDGDADRLGVINEDGEYITSLQVFALLAYYFLEIRGLTGPIIKSVSVGRMALRIAKQYGVPVHETGVGFKYIAPMMMEKGGLLGGEESGGYAFRGHLPERDGVVSGLFLIDLLASTGKNLSSLIKELCVKIGPHYYERIDLAFPENQRQEIETRVASTTPHSLGGLLVHSIDTLDGVRFNLDEDAWVMVRFSGTEPLLRIYSEADNVRQVRGLLEAARGIAGI